jgi:halocyanin-like protein
MERRRLLAVLGGSVAIAGCSGGDDDGNETEGNTERNETDTGNETDASNDSTDDDQESVPPDVSFAYTYRPEERTVLVRVAGGDPFDPSQVSFLGSVENAGQTWLAHPSTPDDKAEVTAGDEATLSVETESGDPDTYRLEIEWTSESGDESVRLSANTGPDRAGVGDTPDPEWDDPEEDDPREDVPTDPDLTPTDRARAYLGDDSTNGYDGSVADTTGSDSVTVRVGGGSNGIAFDPAALRVNPGTTVTWEWTGMGGAHSVTTAEAPEGGQQLDSGAPVSEEGHTYSETLDTPGAYLYYCTPHRGLGMRGAIVVE